MGAVNVGSASVTIMPTMNGFAGKLNKQLGIEGSTEEVDAADDDDILDFCARRRANRGARAAS